MQINFGTIIQYAIPVAIVVAVVIAIDQLINRSLKLTEKRTKIHRRTIRQIKLFSRYLIILIAIFIILGLLGINVAVIAAGAGVLGIAIGFAAKDILSNFYQEYF
jgi:small conductance mechanosensitive channel